MRTWHVAAFLFVFLGPAHGQTTAPGSDTLSTELLALQAAPDESATALLEAEIRRRWLDQASPVTKLLIARAFRNLQGGSAADAFDDFEAVLDLQPNLIEGWRGRAQARFRLGDGQGAVRDLQEVLRREPRHFAALEDLSRFAQAQNDWKGALAAWQKVLEIAPKTPEGQSRLRDLRRRALGEDL